jgi:hypothetical protein
VSSDFGQLVGMRHLISGIDCAIAGAAMVAAAAAPKPVTLMKSRRFMDFLPSGHVRVSLLTRLGTSLEHSLADFHPERRPANAKSPAKRPGFRSTT